MDGSPSRITPAAPGWHYVESSYARYLDADGPRYLSPAHERESELFHRRWEASQPVRTPLDILERTELADTLTDTLGTRSARREAEQELAWYIRHKVAPEFPERRRELEALADALMGCREEGAVGARPEGGVVVAWDEKCGQVRLCPDESREETQRLSKHYQPAILEWARADPRRRLYYLVATTPNPDAGCLAAGKRWLFDRFTRWYRLRYAAAPVQFYRAHGRWHHDGPTRKRTLKAFPEIRAALVCQEDPLSALGNWNPHLNIILGTQGPVDFKRWRDEWGHNLYIKQVDPDNLSTAILELVKYSAKQVPLSPDGTPEDKAPAMIEWPAARWLEWWDAQDGFRRVRSYGDWYAIDGKRWDANDPTTAPDYERARARAHNRLTWAESAGMSAQEAEQALLTPWKELAQDQPENERRRTKDKLRTAISRGPDYLDLTAVRWVGRIKYAWSGYELEIPGARIEGDDLIEGHNFPGSHGRQVHDAPPQGPPLDTYAQLSR